MDSKIRSTKCFLFSKGIEIGANNNWLQNCVQWFVEENSTASINELHTFVYDQFLLADLRDVQLNCLPTDISEHNILMLDGKYTLQVDSIQDVSQSCYSQIQIIRGTGKNTNVENQDARSRNHADSDFNVKPTHMLKLNMTDGVQHVFGMEYEMLSQIREGFIPGCKVVLSGPIEIRRGVFFLKAENFHLLGGELDSIITQNSVENVLARILKLNENPNAGPISIFNDITNNVSTQPQPSPSLNDGNNVTNNQTHGGSTRYPSISNPQDTTTLQNNTHTNDQRSSSLPSHINNVNHIDSRDETDDWYDDELMDMHVWNTIDLPSTAPPSNSTRNSSSLTSDLSDRNTTNITFHQSYNPSTSRSFPPSNSNAPSNAPSRNYPPTSSPNQFSISSSSSNHLHSISSNNKNNLNSVPSESNSKRYPSPDLTPPAKRHAPSTPSQNVSPTSSHVSPPPSLGPPVSSSELIRTGSETSTLGSVPIRMSLARIKTSPPPLPFSMVFRGCKVKSMEKLSVSKGTWRLPAKITDDEIEFLNVDFSDPVIFSISGVSAAELQSKKKQMTTDLELRKTLEEMVQNTRRQILNYEGPMKITFTACQKPTVVSLPK